MVANPEAVLNVARRAAALRERLRIERVIAAQRDMYLGRGFLASASVCDELLEAIKPEPGAEPVETPPPIELPTARQLVVTAEPVIEDRLEAPAPDRGPIDDDEADAQRIASGLMRRPW